MKKYFNIFVLIFIVASVFFLLINNRADHQLEKIKSIKIAGQEVEVDLALTASEHERGLSGRMELKENEGLLFVFDRPGRHSFWMKDMNFPIDIIWLAPDMKVIYIKKDARPELYPETYEPTSDAKYVLEVVSGFSEKNSLKEGDAIEFVY